MKIQIGVSDEIKRDFMTWVIIIALWLYCRLVLKIKFSLYSHIFPVYKGVMYHAVERGICEDDFEEYKKTHIIRGLKEVELYCTEEEFFAFHNNFKGRPFTYFQFLQWFPILGLMINNRLKRMWCAEYVALMLFVLARRYEFENPDKTTPLIYERI